MKNGKYITSFISSFFLWFGALAAEKASSDIFMTLSEAEYKTAIDVLSRTSEHNALITRTIQNHILPHLDEKATFLDVGSGPGIITRHIQDAFISVTAVEPNEQFYPIYQDTGIDLQKCAFADFHSEKKYDFVLCSHVLYHMPEEIMREFIHNLLKYTKPGGYCLIALMAPRGENHKLHEKFNPNYINSNQVKKILQEMSIDFSVIEETNHFIPSNQKEMRALCRFFVFEDCISQEQLMKFDGNQKEDINKKIKAICKDMQLENDSYRLDQEEDYIIIHVESYSLF